MDEHTTDGLKDTARQHANRDEVRAGIPLLFTMVTAGLLAAYAAHPYLPGEIAKWTATIGVFCIVAHVTGIVYSWTYSTLRARGEDDD